MKIKGKALMIRVDGHTIALATNCTFEATLNTLDARTLASIGTDEEPDFIAWNISTESLLGVNSGTEQHTYATLMDIFLEKDVVEVEVFLASGTDNSVPAGDWQPGVSRALGFTPYAGMALIKSVSIKGGVTGSATISIKLSGQGELRAIEQVLTSRIEGNTLVVEGPISIERGEILVDGEFSITDNTIEL